MFKDEEIEDMMLRIWEGKDRVKGLSILISDYVKDMTNFELKSKMIEICEEIESKDQAMIMTGKTIIEKLWRCIR